MLLAVYDFPTAPMAPRTAQPKLAHLLQLCWKPGCQRTQEDIWFIRDRLHETSSFFRLWPSTLQQLLCRIAQARTYVQHEVLAAAGSKPEHLCFILDGRAAVAVRAAPGSSLLKDVAILGAGDTFGELCLLGKERHPAFVVARSALLTVLVVDAHALAAAMPAALQQATAQPQGRPSGAKASSNASSNGGPPEASAALQQQQQDTVSVDALYQLIGQPRQRPVRLKPSQADQVRQLYSRQLQEAAAAEAATVGAWQQLPHQRISSASGTQGRPATAARSRPAAAASQAAAQGLLYEVRLGDELACAGATATEVSRVQAEGTAECRPEADALHVQTSAKQDADSHVDGVPAQQEEEQQQQQSSRSPLMHHAAIMHFAALRAAAVGQPS